MIFSQRWLFNIIAVGESPAMLKLFVVRGEFYDTKTVSKEKKRSRRAILLPTTGTETKKRS